MERNRKAVLTIVGAVYGGVVSIRPLIAVLVPLQKVNYPKSVKVASHDLHADALLCRTCHVMSGSYNSGPKKLPSSAQCERIEHRLPQAVPRSSRTNNRDRIRCSARPGQRLFAPGHEWFNLLWALIGAVVVGGAVYYYRAFRLNAFPRLGPTPCASYRLLAM